jgi:hypothetical protein
LAESLDGSEDFIRGFGPSIRLGIFIVPLDEGSDIRLQLLRRGMDAATNLLPGELGKPALDLIDPRGRRRREVHMIMRPPRQPVFDDGGFVRERRASSAGLAARDQAHLNIEAVRNLRVDLLEEIEKLGAVALVAFADHEARSDVEGREQRRRAVADMRVSPGLFSSTLSTSARLGGDR